MSKKKCCQKTECRFFIQYEKDYNCCLVAIYENGPMTLREIGERLGISFARVKQIEKAALKKIDNSSLKYFIN